MDNSSNFGNKLTGHFGTQGGLRLQCVLMSLVGLGSQNVVVRVVAVLQQRKVRGLATCRITAEYERTAIDKNSDIQRRALAYAPTRKSGRLEHSMCHFELSLR